MVIDITARLQERRFANEERARIAAIRARVSHVLAGQRTAPPERTVVSLQERRAGAVECARAGVLRQRVYNMLTA
jgi:hypothetical protein